MAGAVVAVNHTGITVSDIDRALLFFRDGLGGKVTEPVLHTDPMFERITGVKGANIRVAYVDLPGHQLELLEYTAPADRKALVGRPCDPGHFHLALSVSDIDALVERLSGFGFNIVGPIQRSRGAVNCRAIYSVGLDNLYLELMDFTVGDED